MTEQQAAAELLDMFKRAKSGDEFLAPRKRAFVSQYLGDFDHRRAAEAVGLGAGAGVRLLKDPSVQEELGRAMAHREQASALRAEYTKQLLLDILEFCPTDHCYVTEEGLCIDPEEFSKLPRWIKRLVEGVEIRFVRGRPVCSVKFMSKTAALAMAAKYTLVQRVEAAVTTVPWDQIADRASGAGCDTVGDRLRALEGTLHASDAGTAPAPQRPVRQAEAGHGGCGREDGGSERVSDERSLDPGTAGHRAS